MPDRNLRDESTGHEDDVDLLEYVKVVWRHCWMISSLFVGAVLTTFAISLTTPKTYEATATVLVPREGGNQLLGSLAVSGLIQQVASLSIPSLTPNRDMLVSILNSRTMAQALVERFRLDKRYESRYPEDAVRSLRDKTAISVSKEGVIAVRTADTDPRLAADMANFYMEELDRLVSRYGTGEAGQQRRFIAEQLARGRDQLDAAEERLRLFQERNRAIVLQEQTRGAIDAAARVKGEIMASEVQLQVMRNFATDANPDMVALRRRIDEMKRQLAQMQYGDELAAAEPMAVRREPRDFAVPFARVPGIGLELARLSRDVKVNETMVTLLTQQLQHARLAEARDVPTVQVLDRAVPAARHSAPKTRLNLTIAGVISIAGGVFSAFALEYVRRVRRGRRVVQ